MLFVVGLAFGSFLNVCVSRIPRGQSIVRPPSHCPACSAAIAWYDNVPIISWLRLRGRCRKCAGHISLRYPAVELGTAVLFAVCYACFGLSWLTLKFCVFCFLLVGLIFMDAETGLLPTEFTYPGIALGLCFSWFVPGDSAATQILLRSWGGSGFANGRALGLLDSVLGGLLGAGFFYLAWAAYYLVRKRHGLGFGDIALMAMSGTFLGVKLTIFVLFVAPIAGALYALALLAQAARRESPPASRRPSPSARELFVAGEFPFGVFLGASSLAAIFVGESAWRWYLSFF